MNARVVVRRAMAARVARITLCAVVCALVATRLLHASETGAVLHVRDRPQPTAAELAAFWKWWGDGKGEISSYRITQNRYGEVRRGEGVLVFVTEEIARPSRIKVESDRVPPADRVPVLKCNRVAKFPTGLYDYSLLTSTFAAIGSEEGQHPFQAMKVSNTTQEWCGSFFGMTRTYPDHLAYTRHSYFETEGDTDNVAMPLPHGDWEFEDNLPIMIRELAGSWMHEGEMRTMALLPSFQRQRFTHAPVAFVQATVRKEDGGSVTAGDARVPAVRWEWRYVDAAGPVHESWWVERAYPHRVLRWQSDDGSSGELLVSQRLPYWDRHAARFLPLRREFKLSLP